MKNSPENLIYEQTKNAQTKTDELINKKEISLTTLNPAAKHITVINTYCVVPERAEELLALLIRATDTVKKVPGFLSANFHMNNEGTQIVNYAQWESREAIISAGANPNVLNVVREAAEVAESFSPVLYELCCSIRAHIS